jgi:hypothetical protein
VNDAADHASEGLASRLGIVARTFRRETPQEVAVAVAQAGYPLAHWNFAAIGRSTLAGDVDQAQVTAVRPAFDGAGVGIPSVSATFNLIHPDTELRAAQTTHAVRLIGLVPELGADVVTLCSARATRTTCGAPTRETWPTMPGWTCGARWTTCSRPGATPGYAWASSPNRATSFTTRGGPRSSWGELGHYAPIGIVLDPANLLSPQTVARQSGILAEAVDLLGTSVIGVQAKDVVASGYSAAGVGLMDYPACSVSWLASLRYR